MVAIDIKTTNQKVAGSSPAERAPNYPANRSNSRRPELSIRRPQPARFNCTANRRRMAFEPILAPSPGPFLCRSQQPRRSCSPRRPRLACSLSCSGRHLLIDDDGIVAVADLLYGVLGPFLIVHGASYLIGPVLLYEGRRRLVELFAMDASANHVVIVGGPEAVDELLSMVLDDGKAIPLFDSVEEAETFLASTGEFGKDWRAREVRGTELIEILEYQGEEVEYVALSPPPENLEGGMEVNVIYREILTDLLRRQLEAAIPPKESRGFWRGLFGR